MATTEKVTFFLELTPCSLMLDGTSLQDTALKVKAASFNETLAPSSKLRDMPFQNIAERNVRCAGHLAIFTSVIWGVSRSQWSHGLRLGSAAARLLGLWVRIPPGAWMAVCCECCVLLGASLCDGLITRPEESYRLWCV
jgi:hypothetical protein